MSIQITLLINLLTARFTTEKVKTIQITEIKSMKKRSVGMGMILFEPVKTALLLLTVREKQLSSGGIFKKPFVRKRMQGFMVYKTTG